MATAKQLKAAVHARRPAGNAPGRSLRSTSFTSSSRNYARVAFLNDALRDFDQVEGAIARQFDFSELELGAVRF